MIKVKFNGHDEMLPVSFSRAGEHIITLVGDVPAASVGFQTYRMDGVTQLGDFSDYSTVYRVQDDGCQYSNDGSVWHEPEPIPTPIPEPTPVFVTDEIGNTYRQDIGMDGNIHLVLVESYTGELFE